MAILVGCFVAQIFVRGILGVLIVSVSFDLIDLDSSGVGWLAAAMGVGGIAGAMYAVTLTGKRRLGRPFALALVLWGSPIAVIGLLPHTVVAVVAMLVDRHRERPPGCVGFTLIQRLGIDRTLGRVFGVLYTFGIAMGGLGSLAAPPLISWLGLRTVFITVGSILPVARVGPPAEVQVDRRTVRAAAGGAVAAHQDRAAVSATADHAGKAWQPARQWSRWRPEAWSLTEGDPGDLFYVIADGEVEVTLRRAASGTLGEGEQFGEIALLRDSNRTATVVATRPTRLVTIDGRDFVDAVSSSEAAFSIGCRVADEPLSRDQTDEPNPLTRSTLTEWSPPYITPRIRASRSSSRRPAPIHLAKRGDAPLGVRFRCALPDLTEAPETWRARMQKNLTLRLTVLCAVSSLTACGSSGTATTTEPSDASAVTTTSADSASTAVAVDGFMFAPPAGDYSVVFPIEPTANEQMVPLADGAPCRSRCT